MADSPKSSGAKPTENKNAFKHYLEHHGAGRMHPMLPSHHPKNVP